MVPALRGRGIKASRHDVKPPFAAASLFSAPHVEIVWLPLFSSEQWLFRSERRTMYRSRRWQSIRCSKTLASQSGLLDLFSTDFDVW